MLASILVFNSLMLCRRDPTFLDFPMLMILKHSVFNTVTVRTVQLFVIVRYGYNSTTAVALSVRTRKMLEFF
jgi:hypothetical protein